ncbi:MAG: ATP-binding cassette domain-containing protein [Clostridia bacterium]|nr:ATP-binding cassette domain-containing protein [Clostridia bacterium]
MSCVLETVHLSKRYKNQWALKDVNMRVEKGDIYGFVGENGSGKTTVIRLVTGLISATEGGVSLFGVSDQSGQILSVRKKVGAVVETPSIYMNMSARENLKMQSDVLGLRLQNDDKIQEVLAEVGLAELYQNKKSAGNFSLGMRQRLGIAMALLGDPEFLILDEPMNGLDPAGIVEIRELILQLNRERGITFLISSHILSELALVATKYGIISKGKLVKEISAEDLKKECRPSLVIHAAEKEKLRAAVLEILPEEDVFLSSKGVYIQGEVRLNEILKKILDAGVEIESVNRREGNIEEYYLSLIGGRSHV